MKTFLFLLCLLAQTALLSAQTTAIPDPNFEAKLISLGIDSDGTVNGLILNSDAAAVTSLDVSSSNIDSLTGIAAFINLDTLHCNNNNIYNLDLSSNTSLFYLNCNRNNISNIDLSNNTALLFLDLSYTSLDSLDISNNNSLVHLNCFNNDNLSRLDVSNHPTLNYLNCEQSDNLISLNASNCTALVTILYGSTQSNLYVNISGCTALGAVPGSQKKVYSLNASNCTSITNLFSQGSNIRKLNVSGCTALWYLNVEYNYIDSLNVTGCTALIDLRCSVNKLKHLNTNSCPALISLYCRSNKLVSLQLSNNTALDLLYIDDNNLSNLDVSNNTALTFLVCSQNRLSRLDVSNNINLTTLSCGFNNLTTLDLSNNTNLVSFRCHANNLTSLDISIHINLTDFWCHINPNLFEVCVYSVLTASTTSGFIKNNMTIWTENCIYPKASTGTITIDNNNNCTTDSTEQKWANQLLKFEKGATVIYAVTNDSGDYVAHLDTGTYTVSVIEDFHPYWTTCPNSQTITVDTNYNLQTVDFVLQPNIQCPYLEVDISAPILRRCFDNNYYVTYCNNGTIAAQNAYVEVELDTTLHYNSSTATLLSQVGNIYRFDVGNIAVGGCGSFSIDVTVSCNAQLGQIHCAEAHIYPDSLCLTSLNDIQVTDSCSNDTILYQVTNYADAFGSPLSYLILEDTTIVDTGSIQLTMGQSITISYYTGGNTKQYQLLIAQGNSDYYTVSHRRSCNSAAINMEMPYHPTVQHPSIAFDCQSNIGSYDPNDKKAMQQGIGAAHYIYPNTPLEYHIRFQNTGTDTAIFINILDTLSPFLDVASLEMGAASHPYTWELRPAKPTGEKVLRITFDPIYLPDSNVNEAASHGFVKFKINQLPNLANQTLIENSAAIYFDYNAPIITNTAFHTVCDNCLDVNITGNGGVITSTLVTRDAESFQIYPNPTTGQLHIKQAVSQEATLSLYNINGQKLLQQQTQEQLTTLDLSNYPSGTYILQVHTSKGTENYKVIRQ